MISVHFEESNPIPFKTVEMRGMAGGPVRLPLADAGKETVELLQRVLALYD